MNIPKLFLLLAAIYIVISLVIGSFNAIEINNLKNRIEEVEGIQSQLEMGQQYLESKVTYYDSTCCGE
jgi:hypothetical protein